MPKNCIIRYIPWETRQNFKLEPQKKISLIKIKGLSLFGVLLFFAGCLSSSTPTPRPDPLPKAKDPPSTKSVPLKEVLPQDKLLFTLEGDPKETSFTPIFNWKFPKEWRVDRMLFNLYRTGEYEKGGPPELIVFDLKEDRRLEFSKKHPHLHYYGRGAESLRLLPKTTYTAVLVLQSQPKSLVKKIEFVTSKE